MVLITFAKFGRVVSSYFFFFFGDFYKFFPEDRDHDLKENTNSTLQQVVIFQKIIEV